MAMDVDALTEGQKQQYLRERHCFKCGKIGHRAANCHSGQPAKSKSETMIAQLQELTEEEKTKVIEGFM